MPSSPEPLAGDLIAAVEQLGEAFDARGIRYALLGGLATMLRGRPRFTQDVDVLLDVPQIALPGLLDELIVRGFTLDPPTVIREFVQEHMTAFRFGVVRIDWLKPVLPIYAHALAAATSLPWTEGHDLRVLAPEGLIITRTGLVMRVAAASRGMPTGHSLTPLADVPDGERRDGPPQLVIRREYSVVAMPVLPRRRYEIGEPVEELKRREFDDAVGPRPR